MTARTCFTLLLYSFTLRFLPQSTRLLGPFDQHFNALAGLDILKCLLGILKADLPGDQTLDVHLATGDHIDGGLIIAAAVAEAALGRQLLCAGGHDGEGDFVAAHTALDVAAAHAQDVDGRLHARLGARGVDGDVGAEAEVVLAHEAVGVLLGRHLGRHKRRRGRVLFRKLQPVLLDVDADDLARAQGLGHGATQQAHGPGAEDDDAVAVLDAGLLGDVHGDGERLHQRALLQRHARRQLVAKVLRQRVVLGQRAVVGRRGREGHVRAQVVLALLAAHAAPAGHAGFHGHLVAFFQRPHLVAHLHHGAGRLVAQHHGVLDDKVPDAPVLPVVDVGAADARVVDLEEHIVRRVERRSRPVFECDGEGLLEHEGFVLTAFVLVLMGEVGLGVSCTLVSVSVAMMLIGFVSGRVYLL